MLLLRLWVFAGGFFKIARGADHCAVESMPVTFKVAGVKQRPSSPLRSLLEMSSEAVAAGTTVDEMETEEEDEGENAQENAHVVGPASVPFMPPK